MLTRRALYNGRASRVTTTEPRKTAWRSDITNVIWPHGVPQTRHNHNSALPSLMDTAKNPRVSPLWTCFCVGIYGQSGSLSEVHLFRPVLAKGFGFGSHVGYYSRTRLTLTRCLRGAYGRLMLNAPWLSSIFVRFMFLVNTADLLDQICPHIKCELQNDKDTKKLTRRKKLTQPCALQCFPYAPSSYDKNLTHYKQVGLWHGSSLF